MKKLRHQFQTPQYRPPVHFPPFSSSLLSLSALCTVIGWRLGSGLVGGIDPSIVLLTYLLIRLLALFLLFWLGPATAHRSHTPATTFFQYIDFAPSIQSYAFRFWRFGSEPFTFTDCTFMSPDMFTPYSIPHFQELHSLLDRARCQGRLDGYMIISPLLSSFLSWTTRHEFISLLFPTRWHEVKTQERDPSRQGSYMQWVKSKMSKILGSRLKSTHCNTSNLRWDMVSLGHIWPG